MKKSLPLILIALMLFPALLSAQVTVQVWDATNGCPYAGCFVVANVNDGANWNAVWGETSTTGELVNNTQEGEAFDYWVAIIVVPDGYMNTGTQNTVQVDFDTMGHTYQFVIAEE